MRSTRALHKEWKNKRSGFTRRIQWFQDEDGSKIRLKFTDLETEMQERNLFYFNDAPGAQTDWQSFIAGETMNSIAKRKREDK